MVHLKNILATDAESFKGKFFLLVLDKLLLGAFIAIAFVAYDRYRTIDQRGFEKGLAERTNELEVERRRLDAVRTERAAELQRTIEQARLARELIPIITDSKQDVLVRAHLLESARISGVVDAERVIAYLQPLYNQGLPDADARRIARLALPEGLATIARHSARLRDGWGKHANLATVGDAKALNLSGDVAKERKLWREALLEALPLARDDAEEGATGI